MQGCGRVFGYCAAPARHFSLFLLRKAVMCQLLDVVHQAIQMPLRIHLGLDSERDRSSRLLCRRLANTGSTVAMRWP